jgi:hypothetical protein
MQGGGQVEVTTSFEAERSIARSGGNGAWALDEVASLAYADWVILNLPPCTWMPRLVDDQSVDDSATDEPELNPSGIGANAKRSN